MATANAINANGTGIASYNGSGTWTARTLTQPAAGFTITNGNGVSGNPTFALSDDLAAVEGLSGTGIAARTASNTWTTRTITGTSNQITLSNGNGVSGNPTISLPSTIYTNISFDSGSNTLQNYVQSGSWTPTITGTPSYTIQQGAYMRIGNLVWVRMRIQFTGGPAGSNILISGLPFSGPNVEALAAFHVFRTGGALSASNTFMVGQNKQGTSQINVYQYNPTTGVSSVATFAATDDFDISGSYNLT